MRYLCEACERLAPPAAFGFEVGVLTLICARCGAVTRVPQAGSEVGEGEQSEAALAPGPARPAAAPAPAPPPPTPLRLVPLRPAAPAPGRAADAFAVPPGHCPKCVAPRREGAQACPHCGLVYANFRPEEQRPSAPLGAAWMEVLGRWDDAEAHDRLLSLALGRGELAAAGRLYRIRLAQAPDDVYARRGRDEVLRLASAPSEALERPAPAEAPAPGRALQLLLALLLLVGVLAGALLLIQHLRG